MVEALLIGALAASSLVLGAGMGVVLRIPDRALGLLLGLGAGALISGVSLELAQEALAAGGAVILSTGLATGGLLFFGGDRLVDRRARRHQRPRGQDVDASGSTLALGALLDGLPEQAALGIGLAAGDGVGLALVGAVFLSNVPEALGSAAAMRAGGRSGAQIMRLWVAVATGCVASTALGFAVLGDAGDRVAGFVLALAAGAVLVMLVDALVPEAVRKGGTTVGLATVLGFALAALASAAG